MSMLLAGAVSALANSVGWLAPAAIDLTGNQRLLMILPLCLSIAVVYKTTRCERLEDIPRAALVLWLTILLAMAGVGLGLWLLFSLLA